MPVNHTIYRNTGAVILAAGNSSRMGFPKPFLPYNYDKLFIEKIIDEYSDFGCRSIVIVHNSHPKWKEFRKRIHDQHNLVFIENKRLEYERFYSVKLGLQNLINEKYCFIHNADNPFIDNGILKSIYQNRSRKGYTVPVFDGKGGHPVLFSRSVIDSIIIHKENSGNLKAFLSEFDRKNCDVTDGRVLININDRIDYKKHFTIDIDEFEKAVYV